MSFTLKVSEKEKYKNEGKWFKEYMKYIFPDSSATITDYEQMKSAYEIVNMDLSSLKDKINMFCNPLGDIVDSVTEELDPLPDLKIKIEVLAGESLKRNDQYVITLLTDQAIKAKNEEQMQLIQASIEEKLSLELMAYQKQLEGMPQEEAQKLVQELRSKLEPEDLLQKDWLSDLEIIFSKILKNAYIKYDIKYLVSDTVQDAAIADRFYVYNGWRNGKPFIEIRNPLQGEGNKDPNNPFVHKGNWFWYKKPITLTEAITTYNLSDKDIDSLYSFGSLDQRHGIGGDPIPSDSMADFVVGYDTNTANDKALGLSHIGNDKLHNDLIWETHFEFVAFKQVGFLTYFDEYNQSITEIVSDFEIPKDAQEFKFLNKFDQESKKYVWFDKDLNTEFEFEELWIPRLYEIVRLGNDVYPIYREVPYKPINPDNPFEISLSTKGIILNNRNSRSMSPVQRAISLYLQLLYVHYVENKELSKYQGFIHTIDVDQIPDDLGLDANGKQVRDKIAAYLAILRKTSRDFYSGTQTTTGGLPPSTRSPGSNGFTLGVAVELLNLHQLKELLKREIGMAMGISPQRESSFTQGSNVSDNQQAITQSYTITEPLFYKVALVWKEVLSDYLTAFRLYYQKQFEVFNVKEIGEHIWLPDGTQEVLKITPKHLTHADIGLHLTNTHKTERYAEIMLQQSLAFAQNQGQGIEAVSQLIKDITAGISPEEIHKKIAILEQKSFERQQSLQQQNAEMQKQIEQMKIAAREDEQAHEMQLVRVKAELDLERETIKALGFAKDNDTNDNGIPDVVDLAKLSLEEKKVQLKEKEISHKIENDKEKNKIARQKKS